MLTVNFIIYALCIFLVVCSHLYYHPHCLNCITLRRKNSSCERCSYGCQFCLSWRQEYCKCGFWKRCHFCESEDDSIRISQCGCMGFQRCKGCTRCERCEFSYPCAKYYSHFQKRELYRCTFCIECAFCGVPESSWGIPLIYGANQALNNRQYYWSYDMVSCRKCYLKNNSWDEEPDYTYIFDSDL